MKDQNKEVGKYAKHGDLEDCLYHNPQTMAYLYALYIEFYRNEDSSEEEETDWDEPLLFPPLVPP
jgi:hypothetical protein